MDVFSVMSGLRMTSVSFISSQLSAISYQLSEVLKFFDSGLRRDDPRCVHHIARANTRAREKLHARKVANRDTERLVGLHVDEQRLAFGAEALQQFRRRLCFRLGR